VIDLTNISHPNISTKVIMALAVGYIISAADAMVLDMAYRC